MGRPLILLDDDTQRRMSELRTGGLSQREVARKLGVSRWVVRTRLRESGRPRPVTADNQDRILGVRPAGRPPAAAASPGRSWRGCGCERAPSGELCRYPA